MSFGCHNGGFHRLPYVRLNLRFGCNSVVHVYKFNPPEIQMGVPRSSSFHWHHGTCRRLWFSWCWTEAGNVKTVMIGWPLLAGAEFWMRGVHSFTDCCAGIDACDDIPVHTAHVYVSLMIGTLQRWLWWGVSMPGLQFGWCSFECRDSISRVKTQGLAFISCS